LLHVAGLLVFAFYLYDVFRLTDHHLVTDSNVDGGFVAAALIVSLLGVIMCFKMPLCKPTENLDLNLLYVTLFGGCFSTFSCILAYNGDAVLIAGECVQFLHFCAQMILICFLTQRESDTTSLPNTGTIILNNSIVFLAMYNLSTWLRLSFVHNSITCNHHLIKYFGFYGWAIIG
jgi:hypothetical protein